MIQSKKFDHISLRVDHEMKVRAESDAKKRRLNLNSMLNLILARYYALDDVIDQAEAVPLSKPLFTALLNAIQTPEIERIGRELGPKVVRQTFAFLGLSYDLEGLIENYFEPLSSFTRWFTFNKVGTGANRRLVFRHQYGRKWSEFLRQYLGGIVKSATGEEPKITIDEDLVVVFC